VAKELPIHTDKIGQTLELDCCVAYPDGNSLRLGKIVKMNPKMIKLARLGGNYSSTINKYPKDTIIVESSALTMYLLKNSK